MTIDQARVFFEEMRGVSSLRRGDWIQLAIADASTDLLIGDVGLFLESDESAAELGFTLSREAQGRGHATRAAAAALELIYAEAPACEVRAVTDARNISSVGVLERASFFLSEVREAVFKNEPCTELVYVHRRA